MHGAVNHNEGEGEWQDRMDYGKKAYLNGCLFVKQELLTLIKYTELFHGSNIDLVMLDTRLHGRDVQAGTTGAVVESPTRIIR
jgi:alkaline phosphatase D